MTGVVDVAVWGEGYGTGCGEYEPGTKGSTAAVLWLMKLCECLFRAFSDGGAGACAAAAVVVVVGGCWEFRWNWDLDV